MKRSHRICALALSAAVALSGASVAAQAVSADNAQENCAVVRQVSCDIWTRLAQFGLDEEDYEWNGL